MTTIVDKLCAIRDCKTDIANAIEAKGIPVTGVSFSEYANLIAQITASSGCDRIFYCTVASPDVIDFENDLPFPLVLDGKSLADGDTVLLLKQASGQNGLYKYVASDTSGQLQRLLDDMQTTNLVFVTAGSYARHVFSNATDIDTYVDISIRDSSLPVSPDHGNLISNRDNGVFAELPDYLKEMVTIVHDVERKPVILHDPEAGFTRSNVATLRQECGDDARVLLISQPYKGIYSLKDPSKWEPVDVDGYVFAAGKYGNHCLYSFMESSSETGWFPVSGNTSTRFSDIRNTPMTLAGYGITDAATSGAMTTHKTDKTNPHEVSKIQVGLDKVDNTSDIDKPVSSAVQASLDGKRDNITTTSSASPASLVVTGNTVYTFGELSSLTVTGIETSHNESVIYFTASASGTTITLPAGTPIVDSLNVTAGKKHVLTFMNGIVVLGGCA